jgi:tRNA wybutosine-synthesizing protein 3
MDFDNNKKTFLAKADKSKKGEIDKKILPLVEKINSSNDYFTTSSCSGRIMVVKMAEKKNEAEWLFVSHEAVTELKLSSEPGSWFKFEPPILHVCCRDVGCAQKLLDIARPLFKLSGIISTGKIIVEIRGTERIEAPMQGMPQDYLDNLVSIANKKLALGWKKLNALEIQFT